MAMMQQAVNGVPSGALSTTGAASGAARRLNDPTILALQSSSSSAKVVSSAIAEGNKVIFSTPQGVQLRDGVLPEAYMWPEDRLPRVAHDEYAEHGIPVIDIGGIEGDSRRRREVVEEVRDACKEWGFFQIVNHGFSAELLTRVETESLRLFSLPFEEKMKYPRQPGSVCGYGHGAALHAGHQSWSEAFGMRSFPGPLVPEMVDNLFHSKDRGKFRECFEDYKASMRNLANIVLGLACEGLGIAMNHCDQYMSTNDCLVRLNYYTPCPAPLQTIGLAEHTDPDILTILHQGDIGGLQVEKNGKWIVVRPQKDAFVVNVGDCLQAISNDIYKSVRHRAVVNKKMARLSHAYFLLPDMEVPMSVAVELITVESPAVYKPFSVKELLKEKLSNTIYGKNTLEFLTVMSDKTR